MKEFIRYEYIIESNVEWEEAAMDEGENWKEFKKGIKDENFWDVWNDGRMKDLVDDVVIKNVVEGYYDDEGKEHITKVTARGAVDT